MQTAAPLAFYRSHSAMVTLIAFLPFVDGATRYLLSAGGDCLVNFYRYSSLDREFEYVCYNSLVLIGHGNA